MALFLLTCANCRLNFEIHAVKGRSYLFWILIIHYLITGLLLRIRFNLWGLVRSFLIASIYLQFSFSSTNNYLWLRCILQIFMSFSLLPMQSMISWYGRQPGQISADPFSFYFFQDNDFERDGVNLFLEVGVRISIAEAYKFFLSAAWSGLSWRWKSLVC